MGLQVGPSMIPHGVSGVISSSFNDFTRFKPSCRFPDDVQLEEFDPNSDQIPKQGADSCKLQWRTMRPKFSLKYSRWGQSGQMDTDRFPDFCDSLPYLIYMLKVMAGNPILMPFSWVKFFVFGQHRQQSQQTT